MIVRSADPHRVGQNTQAQAVGIDTSRAGKQDRVHTFTTIDRREAANPVFIDEDDIVAETTVDQVQATVARQEVVAVAAIDQVITVTTDDDVDPGAAVNHQVASGVGDTRRFDQVGTIAHLNVERRVLEAAGTHSGVADVDDVKTGQSVDVDHIQVGDILQVVQQIAVSNIGHDDER